MKWASNIDFLSHNGALASKCSDYIRSPLSGKLLEFATAEFSLFAACIIARGS